MEVTTKTKTPPEFLNKEVKECWKTEKLEKNLWTIKANIEIVKELLEAEYVYEEEIVMNLAFLHVIESMYDNRYDTSPRIPFELGESSFIIGICDLNSNINILSYHAYELISYFIDDPDLEPGDATLRPCLVELLHRLSALISRSLTKQQI
jgi:hypothetical protein